MVILVSQAQKAEQQQKPELTLVSGLGVSFDPTGGMCLNRMGFSLSNEHFSERLLLCTL